jgi:hypothetical protein
MPGHSWSRDPQAAARRISAVNADAQARLSFAIECVNGLHYLVDLDRYLVPNDVATDVLNHNWQVVDMAHVRWAAGSAITALDLCAAALGRLYCGIVGDDRDLSVESAKEKDWSALRDARGGEPAKWITAVRGDHRYQDLLQLRHELTHKCARVVTRFTSRMLLLSRILHRSGRHRPKLCAPMPRHTQRLRPRQRNVRLPPRIRTVRGSH